MRSNQDKIDKLLEENEGLDLRAPTWEWHNWVVLRGCEERSFTNPCLPQLNKTPKSGPKLSLNLTRGMQIS